MTDTPDTTTEANLFATASDVRALLNQLAGYGSMCWNPAPTGVFNSELTSRGVDAAVARLAELLNDRMCTPEERRMLDIVAEEPRPDPDLDRALSEIEARDIVCQAALAETAAEQQHQRLTTAALTAPTGSPAIELADNALAAVGAARTARRDAVEHLTALRRR